MAGKSSLAKEYINYWLVIHYLNFDSVAPYYVCSPQLEIVNKVCKCIIFFAFNRSIIAFIFCLELHAHRHNCKHDFYTMKIEA